MPAKGENKLESDPEYIELVKFLIEKTKDAKSSMNVKQLARDFKEISGSSQQVSCLRSRIYAFRSKIHRMDSIDTAAKVKMLVALGSSIDMDFLNELRTDAHVEVDDYKRITKYRANDGSFEMEGDHSKSAKRKSGWERQKQTADDSPNDSDDGSMDQIPRTPGSLKRAAAAEEPNSSKRTRSASPTRFMKLEDFAPDDSIGSPKSSGSRASEPVSPKAPNPEIQLLRQPKLEEAPGASGIPGTSGANPHQEASIFRSGDAPRVPEVPVRPKSEANRGHNDSEVNDAQTPQIRFLEAIQSFVSTLDTPSLTPLQTKIEKKLREVSSNEEIPNEVMSSALELMMARITHQSVSNIPENVESVSLSHFLYYLKEAIMNSKLEGLEVLMEKIKEKIMEQSSKFKSVPIEKVTSVLQDTLNNVVV